MTQILKTYFNCSSGKEGVIAFYYLKKDKKYRINKLFTSINASYDKVSIDRLRRELLEKQFKILGLPFETIELPKDPSMEVYNIKMGSKVNKRHKEGFTYLECIKNQILIIRKH